MPDAGARNGRLVQRFREWLARGPEVRDIDAAGEQMNVAVQVPLGLVQAVSAGKHDVRALQQPTLLLEHHGRRAAKGSEFVHAVIDDHLGVKMR